MQIKNRKYYLNVKQIVDHMKRLPMDKSTYLEQRLEKVKKKNEGLLLTFPKSI